MEAAGELNRDGDGEPTDPASRRRFPKRRAVFIGGSIVLLILVVGGVVWWVNARKYEHTDDAFIDTHIVHIAPEIAGQVTRVYVHDNQLVRAGDPVIDIDPSAPRAAVNETTAQQTQAETAYRQAEADVRAASAKAANASRDLARYRQLKASAPLAVAQQQFDAAVTASHDADAELDAARAKAAGAEAQIGAIKAQVTQAQINLGHTRIVAPIAGHIAKRTVALGNYVAPGQELMAIVPLRLWVTANFKETQLAHMRVGQPATIDIDACPDADIRGHVDSIQRGAGQAFGILPPENATGNYVKVVQRVPVKIVLDRVPGDCPLGPGMSVEPTVKVR